MKRTSLGEFLKNLRISRGGLLLKEMAVSLGVSSAFLSAVESGKKKFPNDWYEKMTAMYQLSDDERKKLYEVVADTNNSVDIKLDSSSKTSRRLAISFARNFEYIDKDTADAICKILDKVK